jgi:hypothetical protein
LQRNFSHPLPIYLPHPSLYPSIPPQPPVPGHPPFCSPLPSFHPDRSVPQPRDALVRRTAGGQPGDRHTSRTIAVVTILVCISGGISSQAGTLPPPTLCPPTASPQRSPLSSSYPCVVACRRVSVLQRLRLTMLIPLPLIWPMMTGAAVLRPALKDMPKGPKGRHSRIKTLVRLPQAAFELELPHFPSAAVKTRDIGGEPASDSRIAPCHSRRARRDAWRVL